MGHTASIYDASVGIGNITLDGQSSKLHITDGSEDGHHSWLIERQYNLQVWGNSTSAIGTFKPLLAQPQMSASPKQDVTDASSNYGSLRL